ncbi:hypothetical protein H9651_12250 [Microbacterium sp. Sa4CUA7]|uniref:Secreted protein n=1 Tax=Microbacterium pullorum TaxID=2762236 RepID=A0ABR8S4V9_9MICO|nr:hypothetical protein [Microbacterium pullorum]MBD7958414.1 hypothetical protein [Microbacterium pullorum]
METVLLIVSSWWWVAPAAAGVGAVGYGALTTTRRRARRLELDAARQEELTAYRALQAARAQLRAAQADLLTAKAQRGVSAPGIPSISAARQALQAAKQQERVASLQLRASRSRVKATRATYGAAAGDAPLPIEALFAQHDAVTARWLEYETDAGKALSFPQMLDARHPATLAFLRAQHEAQRLRPAAVRAKVTPAQFLAYRDAVRQAEAAFVSAEHDAHRAARAALPRPPGSPIWPAPARGPRPPAST